MKIAYILCGHIRTWKNTIQSHIDYINYLKDIYGAHVDVFISTHANSGNVGYKDIEYDSLSKFDHHFSNKFVFDEIVDIANILNPTDVNINFSLFENRKNYKRFNNIHTSGNARVNQVYNLYSNIRVGILLKQEHELINNFIYDITIKSRFDMKYNEYQNFKINNDTETFNCIKSNIFAGDQFFYMAGDNINILVEIPDFILNLINDHKNYRTYPTILHSVNSEEILTNFLKERNIYIYTRMPTNT